MMSWPMRPHMTAKQPATRIAIVLLCLLSGCTTIRNRRDLYTPQQVDGPYTRMLRHGLKGPNSPATVTAVPQQGGSGKNVIKPKG
jgi:hypothetical protein